MRRIALTGGIAAGKSVAAARFAELGAVVIDYDVLARDAVATGSPGLAAIVERFGPQVLTIDGDLDRAALGAQVFADPSARADLEGIVHPEVYRLAIEQDAKATRDDPTTVVVHDIPLLAETSNAAFRRFAFDDVIEVSTPEPIRLERLTRLRGMAPTAAKAQTAAQASEADRLALATVVLDGSRTPQHLQAQVDDFWREISQPRLGDA